MTVSRAGRAWAAVLAIAGALGVGCSDGDPRLSLAADPAKIAADTGATTLTVTVDDAAGYSPGDVRIFASRGEVGAAAVEGNRVTAELTGLTDASVREVDVQARLGDTIARAVLEVRAGAPADVDIAVDSPYVNADDGFVKLDVAVVDAAGNPVAVDDLRATPTAGRTEGIYPTGGGRYAVVVTGLTRRDDNPVEINVQAGGTVAATTVTILAGDAHHFGIELPDERIQATRPFTLSVRSYDRSGNIRGAFGELAYLQAFRPSAPKDPVPISPISTNLFEDGAVTMEVNLHGFGPDVVLQVSTGPAGTGTVSQTDPFVVDPAPVRCVEVKPTGLDSRVQQTDRLGAEGGFPMQMVLFNQTCASIETDGPNFAKRLAGFEPEAFVHLSNGEFYGDTVRDEAGQETVSPVTFRVEDISYRFAITGLTDTGMGPVRVTGEVAGRAGQVEIEIVPGPWRSVTYEEIPDQFESLSEIPGLGGFGITVPTGFTTTMFPVDRYGNVINTVADTLECRLVDGAGAIPNANATIGTVTPDETLPFTLGVLNQFFSINLDDDPPDAGTPARIYCGLPESTIGGFSKPFRIYPELDAGKLTEEGFATDYIMILPGQGLPPGFPDAVTGFASGDPVPWVAGEVSTVTLIARNVVPGFPARPVHPYNTFLAPTFGGLQTVDGGETREDSPVTARHECEDEPNFLPCAYPDLENAQFYYQLRQDVRLTGAGGVQVLFANPLVGAVATNPVRSSTTFLPSATTNFTVLPGTFERIQFADDITTTTNVGAAVNLELEAVDEFGNVVDYDGKVRISDLTGTVAPAEATFDGGQLDLDVRIYQPWENNILYVRPTDGSPRLNTGVFDVLP